MHDATVNPPTELTERFRPEDGAVFEVLRTDRNRRLWKSTARRVTLPGEPNLVSVRYHITHGDEAEVLHMPRLSSAIENFELCTQGEHL